MSAPVYRSCKSFVISVANGSLGTEVLGNTFNYVILKNTGTVSAGIGFINDQQDGADMTTYATAHYELEAGETAGFDFATGSIKHIGNAGTPTVKVLAFSDRL